MKLKKHHIYKIEWVDTYGYPGWFTEKEIDEKIKNSDAVKSVGFFVKETKDYIILCMGLEENKDFAPYNSPKWIPKGFIKKIKELK